MSRSPCVADYMATDLLQLSPEMEVLYAARLLLERSVSGAPVVNAEGKLVGVLSKKDCLRAALSGAYYQEWGGPVSEYMATKIETIDPELDLVAAAELFLKSPYRRFPILKDGILVGQISRADILRALAQTWPS